MCILSGCLALTFNLRNPRTTNLHANNRFKVARYDESYIVFFDSSRWTHDLVILASRIALGEMGFNARMVLKLSAALLPFCLALSQSMQWVHWNMYLYDAPHSVTEHSLLKKLNCVSGDLALTGFELLIWTSDLYCFGALAVARTLPHVRAWCMGTGHYGQWL